ISEQESQMAPAVTEGAQMRWPTATVGIEAGGYLADAQAGLGGADNHFGGELHARGLGRCFQHGFPAECAHAAVEVAQWNAVENAGDKGEERVSQVTMQGRHCPGLYASLETVPHDEIVA